MLRKDIDRQTVPAVPGVYKFLSKGNQILYIGKAKNLKKRLQQYFSPGSVRKQDMVKKSYRVERLPVKTEQEALLLEIQMINTHTPFYNNLIKGDTSYVYIKIPKGPFPEITLTRYRKQDGSTYIGPKVRKRDLRQLLQMTRHIFQRRACTDHVFKQGALCSDYFFGLCRGWCAYNALERHHHDNNKKIWFSQTMSIEESHEEYQQIITVLWHFFRGNHKPLQATLRERIDEAIAKQHFERAVKLRDMHAVVAAITEKQTVAFPDHISGTFVYLENDERCLYRVVIVVREGRLIDVLTGHDQLEDTSELLLKAAIEREFSIQLRSSKFFDTVLLAFDADNVKKRYQTILHDHAVNFLQWYKSSRLEQDRREHLLTLLEQLKETYHFPILPVHMECIDISHLQGEQTVGGLVTMYYGSLQKNLYKRFKIRHAAAHDDYAALKEVLLRRFYRKNPDSYLPEVCILDGGKWQLGVVTTLREESPERREFTKDITFVALGKGKARSRKGKMQGEQEALYRFAPDGTINETPLAYDAADRLLVKLRDEAHRFANSYRKKISSFDYNQSNP